MNNDGFVVRHRLANGVRRFALGLAYLLMPAGAAAANSEYFVMQVRQAEQAAIGPVAVLCYDNARRPCRREMALLIDGRVALVEISGRFAAGDIYLNFRDARGPIFVGARPFLHIPIGHDRRAHETIVLTEPIPAALDNSTGLYHRPVLRSSDRILARLEIDVRPGRSSPPSDERKSSPIPD